MNLMSVDIPSVTGMPWGKIALVESAGVVRGSTILGVLVYLDSWEGWSYGLLERIVKDHLADFLWLTPGRIGYGEKQLGRPIKNVKGALANVASKIGETFDFYAPRIMGDVLD